MRKYKLKHYSKFRVIRWYLWPEFNVLTSEVYLKPFNYRFIK